MHLRFRASLASAALAIVATALPSAASGDTVANARNATAIYNDPSAAVASGYDLLTDASGIACIDLPGTGAMGVHYVKGALVQSGEGNARGLGLRGGGLRGGHAGKTQPFTHSRRQSLDQ